MVKYIDSISRKPPSIIKLSQLYPVHISAIDNRRLIEGAVLRKVEIISAGRIKKVDVFFSKEFSLAGAATLRVLYGGRETELEIFHAQKAEAKEKPVEAKLSQAFSGAPVSPGYACGKAMLWLGWEKSRPIIKFSVSDRDVEKEVSRFDSALARAHSYYDDLIAHAVNEIDSKIYEAHRMMLDDPDFLSKMRAGIREKKMNAEHIAQEVINQYVKRLEAVKDPYIARTVEDIRNVGQILIERLAGITRRRKIEGQKVIVVAEEIMASDMGEINKARDKVLAIITEKGGPTSHAAIIARTLGIPAVLGVEKATSLINEDEMLAVDGRKGEIITNPSTQVIEQNRGLQLDHDMFVMKLKQEVQGKPAMTRDGKRMIMGANIMSPQEMGAVREFEADIIGLFRTELMFPGTKVLSEDEQLAAFEAIDGIEAEIRTFDLGGDKMMGREIPEDMRIPAETNPFLGLRGIRLYNHNDFWRGLFRSQVRAILRASAKNPGQSIMFPMVSKLEEFRWARGVVEEEKKHLKGAHNKHIKVGVMIEVPSVVSFAEQLAREADYFSFGSNDMIQYMMAADRGNRNVSYLYDPFHFSLIWSLRRVIFAAHKAGKPIQVCGNIGSDPLMVLLLVGLGVDGLSMEPQSIPKIKYVLQGLESDKVKAFTETVYRDYYSLFADTKTKSTRKQLEDLVLDAFPLDVSERIRLVTGKLSSLPAT